MEQKLVNEAAWTYALEQLGPKRYQEDILGRKALSDGFTAGVNWAQEMSGIDLSDQDPPTYMDNLFLAWANVYFPSKLNQYLPLSQVHDDFNHSHKSGNI
jgi:hypothetical protein